MRLPPTLTAWILAGAALIGVLVVRPVPELNTENLAYAEQAQRVRSGETPLFFHVRGETWLPPLPVYLTALAETVTGPIRGGQTAGTIAGAINIALAFLIAHSITGRVAAAFAAALTLLLTAGHTALALSGAASILLATLILLWLERLLAFMKTDQPGAMIGAAANLGLCVYSHPAGPLTAVFLWILTLAVTWRRNRLRLLAGTAAFAAMWVPAAAWFYFHPDTYADTFGRWVILKAHLRNPLDLLGAFFNPNTLGTRASFYWGFWDPSWLFFKGESAAPMFWLEAVLIGVAVFRMRHLDRAAAILLAGAALIVPLAGATFGAPHYLSYAAGVLPLLAIFSGLGVDQLVGLVIRRPPLEDDVAVVPIEGWDGDDTAPRR